MDWSTRKKTGCSVIMGLILLTIGGYVIYLNFFKTTPTCFDNAQNQNERGVDCGGVCALVCPMDAKTIVPVWSRVFPIVGDVYSVAAYIENQNIDAGVKKIDYEFRVYDNENILVGDPITGSTFVGPNDKTAIYASPVKTGNRVASNVFFKFTSNPVFTTLDKRYSVPQLSVKNTDLTEVATSPKLSVDVVNDTLFDYKNIEVVAILYDASGNAVNASDTFIDELAQQSVQKVFFTWPVPFDHPITRIEIIPRINPFTQK